MRTLKKADEAENKGDFIKSDKLDKIIVDSMSRLKKVLRKRFEKEGPDYAEEILYGAFSFVEKYEKQKSVNMGNF